MPDERPLDPRRTRSNRRASRSGPHATGEHRRMSGTGEHSAVGDLPPESTRSGSHPIPRGLRSSWAFGLVATAAVASALIFVAWAKMQTVQHTYKIDDLIDAEEELANRQRILRTDIAALRSPAALHALAPGLGLGAPKPGHVVVVTGDPDGLNAVLAEDDPDPEGAVDKGDE